MGSPPNPIKQARKREAIAREKFRVDEEFIFNVGDPEYYFYHNSMKKDLPRLNGILDCAKMGLDIANIEVLEYIYRAGWARGMIDTRQR